MKTAHIPSGRTRVAMNNNATSTEASTNNKYNHSITSNNPTMPTTITYCRCSEPCC